MNKENKVSFFRRHKVLMIICCLVPVVLLLYLLTRSESIGSSAWLILLICPLMHIVMMWGMSGKEHH